MCYEDQIFSIPELDSLGELLLGLYSSIIRNLMHGEDKYANKESWGRSLEDSIGIVIDRFGPLPPIDNEDIWQQMCLIWLQAWKAYQAMRPIVWEKDLQHFLTMRTIWGIRDWLTAELRQTRNLSYNYFVREAPQFLIDLDFLCHGTGIYPLSELSTYERYLIFLRFREEKTLAQIAKTVYKHHSTVQYELRFVFNKLRRLANAKENTGRSCNRRDGSIIPPRSHSEDSSSRDRDVTPETNQRDC